MRKRRKWAEGAAMWAIGLLAYVTTFPAAVYVHENVRVWEGPAVFVSFVLGVLPILWYWRTKRFGWVAGALSTILLLFSFTAALFHGWQAQASALILVATVVFLVVFFVSMARLTQRVESLMREVGEEPDGDPMFRREPLFRDDGQRITVYPRRRRLFVMGIGQAAILAGFGWGLTFVGADNVGLRIALGLCACLMVAIFLATLYRLVIRRPSLVVGPNGLLDSGTLLWSGVGLIRWDEVLAAVPTTRSSGWVKQRFLGILVTDLPRIRKRLPLLKRLALRNTYSGMSQLLITQALLETPVDDLAEQIGRYMETHAPPGWRADVTEDGAHMPDNDGVEA